jgi:hypothetical protein
MVFLTLKKGSANFPRLKRRSKKVRQNFPITHESRESVGKLSVARMRAMRGSEKSPNLF